MRFEAWVAAACVGWAACGGGSHPTGASAQIGTAGGTVATSEGTAVVVPAGALSSDTSITIAPATDAATPSGSTVGTVWRLGPEGLTFAVPVVVRLAVATERLPGGKTLADVVLQTAPAGSGAYVALPTRVADATHVEAEVTRFSDFAPTASATGGGGELSCSVPSSAPAPRAR